MLVVSEVIFFLAVNVEKKKIMSTNRQIRVDKDVCSFT